MPQTATPPQAPAVRQTRPALTWERHQLFQEPAYTTALEDLDEDDEDDDFKTGF